MAEPRSLLDPFGIWHAIGTRLEKRLTELGDRGVASDEFARLVHKLSSASLLTGRLARALTQRVQETLNVPTRADIQALAERLQLIEDRVIAVASTLDRLSGPRPAGPPRTRRPALPPAAPVAPPRSRARKTRKAPR